MFWCVFINLKTLLEQTRFDNRATLFVPTKATHLATSSWCNRSPRHTQGEAENNQISEKLGSAEKDCSDAISVAGRPSKNWCCGNKCHCILCMEEQSRTWMIIIISCPITIHNCQNQSIPQQYWIMIWIDMVYELPIMRPRLQIHHPDMLGFVDEGRLGD